MNDDTTARDAWLIETVQRLATQAGIDAPGVGIGDSDILFAVAQPDGVIGISAALFNVLTRGELECVIAHEIGHIAHGDAKLGWFRDRASRLLNRVCGPNDDKDPATWRVMLAGGIAALMAWRSQRREVLADKFCARLVGTDRAIAWLERMIAVHPPIVVPGDPMHARVHRLLISHPMPADRIAALRSDRPGLFRTVGRVLHFLATRTFVLALIAALLAAVVMLLR